MKNIISTSILIIFILHGLSAQISFRLIGGFAAGQQPSNADLFLNKHSLVDQFYFNMNKIHPQVFGGITAHYDLPKSDLFTEIRLTYTKRTYKYICHFIVGLPYHDNLEMVMKESERLIQVPVNVGVNLGPLAVTSGLTASISIFKNSELEHLEGYFSQASILNIGWQCGVKVTIEKFIIGTEYQRNLNRVGEGTSLFGQSLALRQIPGQLVFVLEFIL